MKKHIWSWSGGKDSSAMVIRGLEIGMPMDEIIFADTGYEFPELYEYVDMFENYINRKVKIIKTNQKFEDWFYGKWTRGEKQNEIRGFQKMTDPCYWSRESKFKILDKYCEGHYRYIGIAADEFHRKKEYRYPLIDWMWTEKKCLQYLKEKNMLSKIHTDFKRSGCYWCPKQSEQSAMTLYRNYPKFWEQIKIWEKDSPHGWSINFTAEKIERMVEIEKNQLKFNFNKDVR